MRLAFDIETDGLLDTVSKIHCVVAQDIDTGQVYSFAGDDGVQFWNLFIDGGVTELIGHNIMAYDLPVLKKITGFTFTGKVTDTLILSRLIYSDRKERDLKAFEDGKFPGKLIGSHSLEAWGVRMGILKGDFGKQENAWHTYTPEMLEYCKQDVAVTVALYKRLPVNKYSKDAQDLEHEIHRVCLEQEANGFPFNEQKAMKLYGVLAQRRIEIERELIRVFGSWWEPGAVTTPTKSIAYKDPSKFSRVAGASFTPVTLVTFNPSSRAHIARCLTQKYGWKPKEFTPSGEPKVDEDVLKGLKYPEAVLLNEYLLVQKRIGQLAEGQQAWMKLVKNGRIHGRVNTMGTVTSRCSHADPNLGQVPGNNAPYGHECRELFHAPDPWVMLGCDVSGLELRMLAHYMARYDGGAYGKELLNGDIHTANQIAAGLETRAQAKTFIYGFLYGQGDAATGAMIGGGAKEGKKLKDRFLEKTPALKKLREVVSSASEKGYINGLDGRRHPVRAAFASLNVLLQGGGAIVCKRWVVEFHRLMKERGYTHGKDFQQVAFVHDELQMLVPKDKAEEIGRICIEAIKFAGTYYKLAIPLDGEFKIGSSWAETH